MRTPLPRWDRGGGEGLLLDGERGRTASKPVEALLTLLVRHRQEAVLDGIRGRGKPFVLSEAGAEVVVIA